MTVRPNHLETTRARGVISNTAEKVSFFSFGRREQSLLQSFSGNIGTVLSTRYTDVPLVLASSSTTEPGVT